MKEAPQFSNDYRLLSCFFFPKLKIILLVKSVSKAFRLFLSSIVCIYILGFFHNGASLAATFIVTKTSDSADGSCDFDCSLREAIIAANGLVGMDTVVLGIEGTYLISIGGTEENSAASGDLDITDDLNINGLTMASTIIDGGGIDRVLHVDPAATGVEVNISNLTVMNGYAPNESDINNRSGGGIDNRGILNLTNMIVKNNQAIFIGGSGGGLFNSGTLTILNSSIVGNSGYSGGGIGNSGNMSFENSIISNNHSTGSIGSGGGISNSGNLSITSCDIRDNTARVGGGIRNNNLASSKTDILNSTISGNSATLSLGGGIYNEGILQITNCTLSANASQLNGGGIYNDELLAMANVTIVENISSEGEGGGFYNSGAVEIENSIVANNTASGSGNNCVTGSNFSNRGYNLENINTCGFETSGDIINTDLQLGPLSDNGGFTLTHELLADSPAIDAGNPNGCMSSVDFPTILTTDQRGFRRNVDGNEDNVAICDIGAFEFGSVLLKGDVNNSGGIGLDDTVLVLQVISNIIPPAPYYISADINDDGRIGLEESIYILQVISELRVQSDNAFASNRQVGIKAINNPQD